MSGDMLLGALSAAGALQLPELARALQVDVGVDVSVTERGALQAVAVAVRAADDQPHRRLADVQRIIEDADLVTPVKARAIAVFVRLAEAEARVHGREPSDVEFHEVGAVDAIVDIVGVCAGLHALGLDELVVSPIALGGGQMQTAHGTLPIPGPAVLELLRGCGLAAYGGPVDHELATPTGIALLAEWASRSGPMPPMTITGSGVGAGSRDLPQHPNVLRLVVGERLAEPDADEWQVMAANIDDLDPRLWPGVIDRLLAAGAVDAWLTPILMKKGRPAHTVHVMCAASKADGVRRALF
ncbi:MAG TPA: LarC family nickel insertion protein, partial [Mycobacteriales bacterium]|nr:LarC family nickel insertion protein [Mycobacteriales bacterium]